MKATAARVLALGLAAAVLPGCSAKVACLMVKGSDSNCLSGGETIQDAMAADRRGAHAEALRIYKLHADRGDPMAMQTVGLKHYNGQGTPQDYCAAMDWFLKAMDRNADAFNAVGVMHREGQCVPQNRKIAYDVFMTIHMRSLGNEATQMRANSNFRREIAELPKEQRMEALCYTPKYVVAYLFEKGRLDGVPAEVLPSAQNPRFKDMDWWTESEKKTLDFPCPAPW